MYTMLSDMTTTRANDTDDSSANAPASEAEFYREGNVVLSREGWLAVMTALEGDHSRRDDAFDALQRWAPRRWLAELDEDVELA